jgi:hypothetical protein
MFLEVPVHGQSALLLWNLRWNSTSWQEHIAEEVAHLMAVRKERKKNRRAQGSNLPFRGTPPNDLTSFHEAPPPKGSTTSQ